MQKIIIMIDHSRVVFKDLTPKQQKDLFMEICEAVVDNNTSFTQEMGNRKINYSVFNKILLANPELAEVYKASRMLRADSLFEEIIEIADTPIVGNEVTIEEDADGTLIKTITKKSDQYRHRQIQIDARKWAAQRMNPFKYGDKLDITSDNKPINQVTMFEIPNDGRNAKND